MNTLLFDWTGCQGETTLSMTVARCCVQDRDWKSSMHSREDTEWGSMCWMVLGDVAIPKMNVRGSRSMYRLWNRS